MRRWRCPAAVVVVLLLITGCSDRFAPVAVGDVDGSTTVSWKFCDPALGIGSVTVSRVSGGDAEEWPVVWEARLADGATATSSLAIASEVPGYDIDAPALPLATRQTYAVTDAVDSDGLNALASVLEFTTDSLGDGTTSAAPPFDGGLAEWLSRNGPRCG